MRLGRTSGAPIRATHGTSQPRLQPPQVIVLGFALVIALGTLLLSLPVSHREPTRFVDALFTSTSAVSVTGLSTVDTATHWTVFGQVVILILIEIGGLGVMSAASLLGILVARRIGLRTQLTAEQERGNVGTSDVRRVLIGVAKISLAVQAVIALVLAARWMTYEDYDLGRALWFGVFHSVAAYNNAGFGLLSDNLMPFASDWLICLPIAAGLIIGGLGFPVLYELRREYRSSRTWTLTTKVVLAASGVLLLLGTVGFLTAEWRNDATLGAMSLPTKLLTAFFHSANTRTAGFNTIDVSQMTDESWFMTDMLMFVGAAPAGTSGGIKVTTLAVLFFIMRAEFKGERDVVAFRRTVPTDTQRQAVTVAATATLAVVAATLLMTIITPFAIEQCTLEIVSAFSTVGLSTGITTELSDPAKLLVAFVMLAGRLGVMTLGTALALRSSHRAYTLPDERPLIS